MSWNWFRDMKRAQKEALKRQKEESTANSAIHRFVENLKKSEQQEMGAHMFMECL